MKQEIKNKLKAYKLIRILIIGKDKIIKEIRYRLPKEFAHKRLYKKVLNKNLNLKEPKDFNEKIHYLILHKYGALETRLADKYSVRDYIEEKGYKDILLELYGVYDNPEQIKFEDLPNQFVLKTNHGSGDVKVCSNKSNFDINKCKKELKKSLNSNFSKNTLEYHYSKIKPRIICEQYINDGKGNLPIDYKIYCFNGKPECILICSNRDKKVKVDYYDLEWNYLEYAKKENRSNEIIEKPENLDKMLKIAEDLSKDMTFVRVDLYNAYGKIYFGELTFTPAAGLINNITQDALNYLGQLIKI